MTPLFSKKAFPFGFYNLEHVLILKDLADTIGTQAPLTLSNHAVVEIPFGSEILDGGRRTRPPKEGPCD